MKVKGGKKKTGAREETAKGNESYGSKAQRQRKVRGGKRQTGAREKTKENS